MLLYNSLLALLMVLFHLAMPDPLNRSANRMAELYMDKNTTSKETDIRVMGEPETGAGHINRVRYINREEEEPKRNAKWETSRCFVVSLLNRVSSHFFRREKLFALTLSVVLGIFGADWFYLCVTE